MQPIIVKGQGDCSGREPAYKVCSAKLEHSLLQLLSIGHHPDQLDQRVELWGADEEERRDKPPDLWGAPAQHLSLAALSTDCAPARSMLAAHLELGDQAPAPVDPPEPENAQVCRHTGCCTCLQEQVRRRPSMVTLSNGDISSASSSSSSHRPRSWLTAL